MSGVDGFWKSDEALKVMSGEAGMSVPGEAMMIDGAAGSVSVSRTSGMCLGTAGGQGANQIVAAAGDTEVLGAKMKIDPALGLHDSSEYILRAQSGQHHCQVVKGDNALFTYLAHNKANSNRAMPRRLRYVDDTKLN